MISFYLLLKWEYLSVEWGSGNDDSASSQIIGYAHPIEDSNKIDNNFCLDVVAGMLQMVGRMTTTDSYIAIVLFNSMNDISMFLSLL
jgi:hypothetical protein